MKQSQAILAYLVTACLALAVNPVIYIALGPNVTMPGFPGQPMVVGPALFASQETEEMVSSRNFTFGPYITTGNTVSRFDVSVTPLVVPLAA
jgi:hypothetical protein